MLRLAILLAVVGAPASAGTLTFEFFSSKIVSVQYPGLFDETTTYRGPAVYEDKYVFDVDKLNNQKFDITMELNDYRQGWIATDNPDNAVLLEAPDGHLSGYEVGKFTLSIFKDDVSVSAWFRDLDDYAAHGNDFVYVDHNSGLRDDTWFGFWRASYIPDGPKDGKPFTAVVPLPASLLLLGGAIASFGLFGYRERNRHIPT